MLKSMAELENYYTCGQGGGDQSQIPNTLKSADYYERKTMHIYIRVACFILIGV